MKNTFVRTLGWIGYLSTVIFYVFSFVPFSAKVFETFWNQVSFFRLIVTLFSHPWGEILWISFGLLLIVVGFYLYNAWNEQMLKSYRTIKILILLLLLVALFSATVGIRSIYRFHAHGAMQYLVKGDILHVRVDSMSSDKGFWTYPTVRIDLADSSKTYSFIHYVFDLRGHKNVYVFQRYWTQMNGDTLFVRPHPAFGDNKVFKTLVILNLKHGTKVMIDKTMSTWLLGEKTLQPGLYVMTNEGLKRDAGE